MSRPVRVQPFRQRTQVVPSLNSESGGNPVAKIYEFPNADRAANVGEQRVIDALRDGLPDDVVLIPNITVIDLKQTYECDVIVVTGDAVFVVETKDLVGSVSVREQELVVDGQSRKNPYETTRKKAQYLRSRLDRKIRNFPGGVWVEPLVVLASKPAALQIDENLKNKVVNIETAVRYLSARSAIVHPDRYGHLAGKTQEIVEAICFASRPREKRDVFGEYRGLERLFGPPEVSFSAWRAEHTISGFEHVLEVHPRPDGLNNQGVSAWRKSLIQLYSAAQTIRPDRDVDLPSATFELDNGIVVIVWPKRDYLPLHRYLEDLASEEPLTGDVAKKIVAGFAGAMQHLHVQGRVWGKMKPLNLVVRTNGRGAIVIDAPVPIEAVDTSSDIKQLAEIIGQINTLVDDPTLSEILASLTNEKNPDVVPSAGWVAAVCEGNARAVVAVIAGTGAESFDARFIKQRQISQHAYGTVYMAEDSIARRKVVVRLESGREGESWTDLEFRALTHPRSQGSTGVVDVVSAGQSDRGSYVATEVLAGPSLASIIDAGGFREQGIAVGLTLELLATLKAIHPATEEIESIVANAGGVLLSSDSEKLGKLRSAGISHNLVDPTNVIIVDKRGPVLIDFARAAAFGASIPIRQSMYWPDDLPLDVSDPSADVFGAGMILLAMLSGPFGELTKSHSERIEGLRAKSPELAVVVEHATALSRASRYRSAGQFIDALVALKIAVISVPLRQDVWNIQKKIEHLVTAGNFDEALKICAPEWEETRRSIERRRQAVIPIGRPLISINGVELKFIGQREIKPGTTGSNAKHDGGSALLYVVSIPGGGVLEVQVCSAKSEKGLETWVGGEAEYSIPPRMKKLARSLRMNVMPVLDSEDLFVELSQARINPGEVDGNPTLKKSITPEDIQLGIGGADAVELFKNLNAIGYGTRAHVCGETNKNRSNLCVRFDSLNVHIPAVAHFVTRVMPLFFDLKAK